MKLSSAILLLIVADDGFMNLIYKKLNAPL